MTPGHPKKRCSLATTGPGIPELEDEAGAPRGEIPGGGAAA